MEMIKAGLDFHPTLHHSITPVLQKTFKYIPKNVQQLVELISVGAPYDLIRSRT